MYEALQKAVRERQLILFVGAGVSVNLGLPAWADLISEVARQLDYDPEVFHTYGNFLELAEYYKLQKSSIGKLRSWMDINWHKDETIIGKSLIHEAIINLECPVIYTTNYDRWLEIAYRHWKKEFTKISNVGDFAKIRDGVTQIVKFHGDFDDDNSLVLTETSYFERLNFESPLDIKFRSDSIARSILFIGYSVSDINIRYLLYKLQRLWGDSGYVSAKPQSYIYLSHPNPVQEAIFVSRGITPIVAERDDLDGGLAEFLKNLLTTTAS